MIKSRWLLTTVTTLTILFGTTQLAAAKTFVLPHILEASGTITASQLSPTMIPRGVNLLKGAAPKTLVAIDTTIEVTYVGGLPGVPPSSGGSNDATVDLYLYDQATNALLKSSTAADVCAPCTAALSGSNRKVSFNVDDLITGKGGFDAGVKLGFGIIVVGGADPLNVLIQGFVVGNTGKGLDLSVFGFDPVPITVAP